MGKAKNLNVGAMHRRGAYRSRLGEYHEVIRQLLDQGASYREILAHLQEKHHFKASLGGLSSFIVRRSKPTWRKSHRLPRMAVTSTPLPTPIVPVKRPAASFFNFQEGEPLRLKS